MLDALQRDAFSYFLHQTNPANGLVADKWINFRGIQDVFMRGKGSDYFENRHERFGEITQHV